MASRKRGIITMAYGSQRYIKMAKALGKSLKLHNDKIPRAVVTDSDDPELKQLYDIYVPLKLELGRGVKQKLYLDQYSPFEETLYIDSDCIVVKNIEDLWELFHNASFGVVGENKQQGKVFGDLLEISEAKSIFGVDSIPVFNGGLYYFNKSDKANEVFKQARIIMEDYKKLGIKSFRGGIADEPLFGLSLALCGIDAIDDKGASMRSTIKMVGWLKVDVLKGICSFNKEGKRVNPAILHFADNTCLYEYKREQLKLTLVDKFPDADYETISLLSNLTFGLFSQHERVLNVSRDWLRAILGPKLIKRLKYGPGVD